MPPIAVSADATPTRNTRSSRPASSSVRISSSCRSGSTFATAARSGAASVSGSRGRADGEVPQHLVAHRRIEAAGQCRIADAQPEIGHDADDLAPRLVGVGRVWLLDADAAADRIAAAEELLHERLVDDRHRRGAVDEVGGGEQPAGDARARRSLRDSRCRRRGPAPAAAPSAGSSPIGSTAVGRGGGYRRGSCCPAPAATTPGSSRAAATTRRASPAIGMRPSCAVSTWFFGSAGTSSM